MDNQRISIAWTDLSFKVKRFCFRNEKTILNQLNGSIEFNTINALMGPSGAGKTTLLKCLNGELVSGLDPKSKIFVNVNEKIKSCFVGQHSKEHLIMCLTAKQNLIYASKLKNSDYSPELGSVDHKHNVIQIMEEFMIEDIADTPVNRCSGGEQKRLTIAVEMTKIIKPNLLCIDEPTTGLDSSVAENVMDCLRNLSKSHRMSIITSIHQPNNEIVLMFDNIYVLTKDGNCLFSGPPKLIESYLREFNIIMNEEQVPIEQLLKLASIEAQNESVDDLVGHTRQILYLSISKDRDQLKVSAKGVKSRSKPFKPIDMWYIIMRTMTQQYVKQWKALLFQFLWYIFIAFFVANVFNENIGKPDACLESRWLASNNTCAKQLENQFLLFQNLNFLYFTTLLVLFVHLSQTTLTYLTDLKIFLSEHKNKWYSTGSYFWAKNFVEILQTIVISTTYAFLVFKLSGQYSEGYRCLQFVVIIALGFLCTEGIGHAMGIILINYHQMAVLLSIGLFMTMSLYANFFVLIRDMPLIFQYTSELSFFKFFFNSILLIIYGQNRCSDGKESTILYKYGISDNELTNNYIKLAIYAIFLRVVSLAVLLIKNNFDRNRKVTEKEVKTGEELLEFNANDLTIIDFNRRQKRLSLIFSEMAVNEVNDNNNDLIIEKVGENSKTHISIAWTQMTLKIPKTFFNKEKVILRNITGFFTFGTINAIMGCSGSGKTSLLKCINGLYTDYLTNETIILLNKRRRIKTCFITQEVKDHILMGLTAGQAMTYASKLKNSGQSFDHKINVENIMDELLIRNTFDTSVEKCSGGEQKRLIIAMELTSSIKPNLICIDEPTSGLDSNAAEVVIKCLKRLSENHNICVITSIHQPNNEILMLFDKLYVLSKKGEAIYTGRPQHLMNYLLNCGIDCYETQLPIEVLLKHSCNTINDKMVEMTERVELIAINRFEYQIKPTPEGIETVSKRFFIRDLWLVVMRTLTYTYRYYWKLIVFQFFIYIGCGLTFRQFFSADIGRPSGCISFDDLPNKCFQTKEDLKEKILLSYNMSYNFFILTNLMFLSITVSTIGFTSDLKMFVNEHRNGWYSTGVYYWSKTMVEFLPTVLIIFCYTYVVYIYGSERPMFAEYVVFLVFSALLAQSLGHFIAIIFGSNQRLAIFAAVGVQTLSLFFSGFIIPTQELHYSIQMLSCLSPFKLVIENLLLIQYGFERCAKREVSILLFLFDISDEDFYRNSQLLIMQFFLFRCSSLIALLIKVNSLIKTRKEETVLVKDVVDDKDLDIANPFIQ